MVDCDCQDDTRVHVFCIVTRCPKCTPDLLPNKPSLWSSMSYQYATGIQDCWRCPSNSKSPRTKNPHELKIPTNSKSHELIDASWLKKQVNDVVGSTIGASRPCWEGDDSTQNSRMRAATISCFIFLKWFRSGPDHLRLTRSFFSPRSLTPSRSLLPDRVSLPPVCCCCCCAVDARPLLLGDLPRHHGR